MFFFLFLNQLGKVNELLIKPDLSDSTEAQEKEDVLEEESVVVEQEEEEQEESGSKADRVFTVTTLEQALNLVTNLSVVTSPTPYLDARPLTIFFCCFCLDLRSSICS